MLPDVIEIKQRRKSLGLTQKELAMRAGVSQSVIAKIESGNIKPSYSIIRKIFGVFETADNEKKVEAKNIMNNRVVSVRRSDSVEHSINTMRKFGYSQLPVVSGNQTVGTISEKIVLDIISNGRSLDDVLSEKVDSVMGDALPRISENESIDVISALLRNNSAVLVTKKGKTTGIITKADLFKIAASNAHQK